jgi:hypothetical protein
MEAAAVNSKKVSVVTVLLVVVALSGGNGQTICKVSVSGLMACKPAAALRSQMQAFGAFAPTGTPTSCLPLELTPTLPCSSLRSASFLMLPIADHSQTDLLAF